MERTVSSRENAVISNLFKALVGFFKGYTDVFFGISKSVSKVKLFGIDDLTCPVFAIVLTDKNVCFYTLNLLDTPSCYLVLRPLCFLLTHSHACFYHIDNIVAELLTLLNDVHIHRTNRVSVFMIVDIIDVL